MEQGDLTVLQARIARSFARQSFLATVGARLLSVAPGRCAVEAALHSGLMQQHGAGHAGLTFALGDVAAGYAALSLMPEGSEVMTAEMKINLLAPAFGDRLVATGTVERAGRRLVVVRAEVTAEASGMPPRCVALLQGTMVPVDPPAR